MRSMFTHRGLILLTLAAMDIAYGIALLRVSVDANLHWWPGTPGQVSGISVGIWGWIWIVVGLALIAGSAIRRDAIFWAGATLLKWWWAFSALVYFISTPTSDLWGVAAIFFGFGLVILICASWPERRTNGALR